MTISYACDDQLHPKRNNRKSKSDSMRRCKHLSNRNSENDDDIKRFHGDGLVVKMHSNRHVLEITGDGCRIVLSRNSGNIYIVGDGCRLRVHHNEGNIEYIGDGGQVLLGSESVKGKVKFVGDGGKVILDPSSETELEIERKELGTSPKERLNKKTNYLERNKCSCKKVVTKTLGCEKCDNRALNEEELDNVTNDMKERDQGKYGKRNEEARKCLRHQTVRRIITKIQTDGQCVRKRFFNDSSFIVNSCSDNNSCDEKYAGNLAHKR